ncbi:type II secretion system F family protein [Stratiformator vulcanicus]|uniref:Bacterial type II secretion system protein F domain protein n=1 Tax=Stratiformator vulcanicus TaxID=2527980 RepID=A0A517R2P0_9PLAN|nr:type II secretion system F family protein [Stratiformator vulcanicus]QDT38145.1 Bacterial type II secretion system protein F domain protein [Stratiformator vulcanicus]
MATAAPIKSKPEFAGILRERNEFAQGDSGQTSDKINSSFDSLMLQSGLGMSPGLMLAVIVCSALALAGVAFVVQENLLTTGIAFFVGGVLAVLALFAVRARRQKKIMGQIPDMVSELARAARTGRSLESCLQTVAEDTPSPLGDELRIGTRRMAMGVPVADALRDLPERTGVNSLHVFVMALALHSETGGDLVRILERLARAVRDRIGFLGRLRAATAASRATAILMLVVPPAIVLFFIIRDPNYLTDLFDSFWGRLVTVLAIILQIVGSLWVLMILNRSRRT